MPLVLGFATHQVPMFTVEQVHAGTFGNPAAKVTVQLLTLLPTVTIPALSVD